MLRKSRMCKSCHEGLLKLEITSAGRVVLTISFLLLLLLHLDSAVDDTNKLRYFFGGTLVLALFFWCWALKNTLTSEFDLGVVSFGTVVVSSVFMLKILVASKWTATCPSSLAKNLTLASHIFVAINYLLGAIIGFMVLARPGFSVYCLIFTFLWLAIAYCAKLIMNRAVAAGETLPLSS
jgi:hypothetical protein